MLEVNLKCFMTMWIKHSLWIFNFWTVLGGNIRV